MLKQYPLGEQLSFFTQSILKRIFINETLPLQRKFQPPFFPKTQRVPICQETFSFVYQVQKQKTVTYINHGSVITFTGPVKKQQLLKNGHRRFWMDLSRQYLMPRIESFSATLQTPLKTVRFKNQKSVWGSCSELGNLNFNIKLLFLPKDLTDYVIVHELCHLKFLNHSKDFWKLVSLHCPAYKTREKQLQKANSLVPKWIHRL